MSATGRSPKTCGMSPAGRDAQSIVFFRKPGMPQLYSGVAISSPSAACSAALSGPTSAGGPSPSTMSWLNSGSAPATATWLRSSSVPTGASAAASSSSARLNDALRRLPPRARMRKGSGPLVQAPGEDVGDVERRRLVELREAAGGGVAVGAPAHELRRVSKPSALQIVVAHLDDPLGTQRHEREVLLWVPAAPAVGGLSHVGRPTPRMVGEVDHQRLQLGEQLAPARHRERADHPDRRQTGRVVVPLRPRRPL